MPNIQVSHSLSTNNARSESNICANQNNPNQVVGASKKFTNPHAYDFTLAAYYSTNAGNTWTESAPLQFLAGWTGISDPAVAWDNQNNCYLLVLPFSAGLSIIGIAVYKSTDGGATWGTPSMIHQSGGDDKQWLIGDLSTGAVYAAWDDNTTLRFARTTDHGASWKGTAASPASGASLAADSFSPEMALNSSGHLYIFWIAGSTIKFVKSADSGGSFSPPQVAVSGVTPLGSVLPATNGWPHFPGGTFRVLTLVTCCVGRNNEIMVAWADGRESDGAGNHVSRIYYRRSIDGGLTWLGSQAGTPLLANNAIVATTLHHFHPQIINRPNTDQVGCTFYEFGPKSGGQRLIDTMIAYSFNNGGSFGNAHVVTDAPWDPLIDAPWSHGDPNVTFIGDYFGFDASNVGFYPFWTDTRTGIQEIFTDILHPLQKPNWKEIKDTHKESKEVFLEIPREKYLQHDKLILPEKPQFKEKDKDKDVYEDLGQKLATEVVDPLRSGIAERFRALESRIQEIEARTAKGELFIKPELRPNVGERVVKDSNRKARKKQ